MGSKFSKALGIWDLEMGGEKLELVPVMKDIRDFRNIMIDDQNRKDKQKMFDKFADYMVALIRKAYPEESEEHVKTWVELHLNPLLEETMVAFKWTSKEEMDKAKKEALGETKKLMSNA